MLPSKNKKITIIGNTGNIIREAKIEQKQVAGLKISKQLDVITRHLQEIAKSDGIAIRPLWLKPIPPIIYLEDLQKKYNVLVKKYVLNPIVGEFDDPTKQQQCVLRLPLSEKGNLIIYGAAKSGKVSFIETVITSLIQNHTPDEVNLYLLDFGTQTLKAYANAPHVGDVVFSFEQEKVKNLYMFLMNEIKVRQKLFADFGGDYSVFIKNSMEKLPCIVVVLNGFDRYKELYSDYEDALKYLCGEGLKYGIYFIITAQTANSVNYSLRDHFKQLFVLQMNDSLDYNQFFSKVRGMEPSKIFGRGLVSLNESDDIYEFQTAHCTKNPNVYGTMQKLCNELMDNWHGAVAPKIKTLPECVSYEYVKKYA
ncbi:MAG: FtsK/SpoIIIE domain-containing protein, partial [Clostridiales bacterium]